MNSEEPLEELVEEAEENRRTLSTTQRRQREVKERLREHVDALNDAGEIDADSAEQLHRLIAQGDYGEVREAIDEARESSLSTRDMARVISAFDRELNVTDAEPVLEAIREGAD